MVDASEVLMAIVAILLTVCISALCVRRFSILMGRPSKKSAGMQQPLKSMLLPPRPKHKVQPRHDLVAKITSFFTELRNACPDRNTVVVVYVQGPPAFGKTQLACQFAEDFARHSCEDDVVIGTLNASTKTQLYYSYLRLARHIKLGIHVKELSACEELIRRLQLLSNAVREELRKRSQWLLIIDDLTSELFETEGMDFKSFLPLSGDDHWGCGNVLITTKMGSLVEKGGSLFSKWYSLDKGLSDDEGIELLTGISNVNTELSAAKLLVQKLEGIPLSIAAAGCFISNERCFKKDYGFSRYMKDLGRTHRDFAVKQTKQINNYEWTLTTALTMCILQQGNLHKVFCFLASCAHAALPMRLISRVLNEPLDVTMEPIKWVRDSVLLQVSVWILSDDEDSIEVVQTHEVTWNVMREIFIYNTDTTDSLHEAAAHKKPTLSELINIQVLDWFSLGLNLGMNDYELQVIRDNYPRDNKSCKRMMFSKWLQQDLEATYKKLIFALEEMCEFRVASELRRQYGLSSDSIISWSELKQSLCWFSKCLLDEVQDASSPLYDFRQRLLPHILSVMKAKESGLVFDAELQFKLHRCCGHLFLGTAQRIKAEEAFEASLKAAAEGSEQIRQSLEFQNAKLYLGVTYGHLGKLDAAKEKFESVLETLTAEYGEHSGEVALALRHIGGSLHPYGEYEKAENYLKRALSIQEEIHGRQHEDVGDTLISLGTNLISVDARIQESVRHLLRAVSIFEEKQKYRGKLANAQAMLGIAYCYLNKPELADKYFSASLSIFKQLFGDDSAYCATALTGLCVSSFLMGDISKSEAYGKRAISTFDVYPDVSHYRVAALRYQHLATVHCILGKLKTSEVLLSKASDIIKKLKDEKLEKFNKFLQGCNYFMEGRISEAAKSLECGQSLTAETHSVLVAASWLVYLEMGCISEVTVFHNVLKSRPHLAKLLAPVNSLIEDITKAHLIPTTHLLALTVNTYLTRNHITWPAFEKFLVGINFLLKKSYSEAQGAFNYAISQYNKMLGPNNPMTVEAQFYIAMCMQSSDIEEALNIAQKALSGMEAISLCNHPLSAKLSYLLARLYCRRGNKEQAEAYIKAALQKIEHYVGKAHPLSAELYFQLAKMHADTDRKLELSFKSDGERVYYKWLEIETSESKKLGVELTVQGLLESWKVQIGIEESY